MSHSINPVAIKPDKPRPDFPLFPHSNGRWAKKVRGKFEYFGKWADDPRGEEALRLWLEQKDDLLAGRRPRKPGEEGTTIADLCNAFLTAKWNLVDGGELSERSFRDYKATTDPEHCIFRPANVALSNRRLQSKPTKSIQYGANSAFLPHYLETSAKHFSILGRAKNIATEEEIEVSFVPGKSSI